MSTFTIPIGNKELPKEYQSISVDIAELMQKLMKASLKLYIKELLLCMEGIENVHNDLEDWQKAIFRSKLGLLIKLTEK